MKSPTERFTERVENYTKYRPSYPSGVIDTLKAHCGLGPASIVADIGSGTGILTALLLECGCTVLAVEPNEAMRQAAEKALGRNPRFVSAPGSAEQTGLPAHSVDLVTAAQSFHWFRRDETRAELSRILKPGGWIAIIWNERRIGSPFGMAYEHLLRRYAQEYETVRHTNLSRADMNEFFRPGAFREAHFEYEQQFDLDGLKGRLLSSSYCPTADQPEYATLLAGLKTVFDAFAQDGCVTFEYDTRVYYGQLTQSEAEEKRESHESK